MKHKEALTGVGLKIARLSASATGLIAGFGILSKALIGAAVAAEEFNKRAQILNPAKRKKKRGGK